METTAKNKTTSPTKVADNFDSNDDNHQADGATEVNKCGYQSPEGRRKNTRQESFRNWRRVQIIQRHL